MTLLAAAARPAVGASPAFQQAIVNSAPVLYYKLNETSGPAINYGSFGATFNATYFGTIQRGAPTAAGGDAGALFDGVDDYLESLAVVPAGLTGNPTFSAEALVAVRCNGTTSFYPPFLHWGQSGTGHAVYFGLRENSSDRVYCGFYNAGLMTSGTTAVGQFIHLAWVRQGGGDASTGTTIYVNGQAVATTPDVSLCCPMAVPIVDATAVRVNRSSDLTRFFTGEIDELALYDRTLSAGEVAAHYAALPVQSTSKGDLNCDNIVNGGDVECFVTALLNPAGYSAACPNCNALNGDFNASASVTTADIPAFVQKLVFGSPSPFQQQILADAPLLYYQFAEGAIGTANRGSLGQAYNAIYSQSATLVPSPAGDTAVMFNSQADFLTSLAAAPVGLTGNPTFSAEAIVKPTCTGQNYPVMLGWGTAATGKEVFFGLQFNRTDLLFAGFYSGGLKSTDSIPPGQWVHVVWTRQGGGDASTGTILYVNGQPVTLTPDLVLCCNNLVPNLSATQFRINLTADGARFFTGALDEVALYSQVLTPARVLAHYNALPH
ncbi:MAG: LamG domain-containing protein [Phycisphaerae bacterium]